jgi:heme oxygenase
MSLKEITKELHKDAERSIFAKKLVTGSLSVEEYATYLWQMVLVYNAIEVAANSQGMLKNLPDIERCQKIYQDCIELVGTNHQIKWLPETIEYYQYLLALNFDPDRKHLVKAHLYCRHMGDLYGGQMIAKKVPGSGRFYQFKDVEKLKEAIRAELTDDLGDEAIIGFQWAIKIMVALGGHAG